MLTDNKRIDQSKAVCHFSVKINFTDHKIIILNHPSMKLKMKERIAPKLIFQ